MRNMLMGTHSGLKTHHQDQVMTLHNFKQRNTKNSIGKKVGFFILNPPSTLHK